MSEVEIMNAFFEKKFKEVAQALDELEDRIKWGDWPDGRIIATHGGKVCSECGKKVDAVDHFCRHCGAKFPEIDPNTPPWFRWY